MTQLDAAVLAYYDGNAHREHARLDRADCALEFELTTRLLAAHLPPGGRVLEVGGGTGRYTRWLAGRGHRVVLSDASEGLLAVARGHLAGAGPAVEEIARADARDLGRWSDGAFDAVVALGPFYHLVTAADRVRAAREVARVLRPGGVACVAVIPRHAVLRGLLADPAGRARLHDVAFLRRLLDDGVFVNDQAGRFTGVFGVEPGAADAVLAGAALETVAVLAVEGFAGDLQGAAASLQGAAPDSHAALLDALHERAADPSFFGAANHLLVVARRAADL